VIVALARLVVRLSAGLAPAHLRGRWREEWLAEIEAAAAAAASSRAALRILQRAAGAPIDAIAARRAAPASGGSRRRVAWHGWRGDLKQSLRLIARAPGQTTTVVLSLGVGLTACVSVFSIVNSLLWGELPGIRDRATLSQLYTRVQYTHMAFQPTLAGITPAQYELVRSPVPSVAGVAAEGAASVTVRVDDRVISALGAFVSGNYFEVLGTTPHAGRLLTPADEADAAPAVVVGNRFRRTHLGDGDIVGRSLRVGERTLLIVGVAPDRFAGWEMADVERGREGIQIWLPLSLARGWPGAPDAAQLRVTPIVRHGADASRADATAALRRFEPALPALGRPQMTELRHTILLSPLGHPAGGGNGGALAIALAAILAGPLAVLAIACANVANLRLARATERSRELAVRLSLGASRWQVTRLLAIEIAIVAALAVLAGWAGTRVVLMQVAGVLPMAVVPDWRVALFAIGLAIVVVALSGLAPARLVTGRLLAAGLRQTPHAGGVAHARLRQLLVGGQVAVSLVLLIVGALFARSALRMTTAIPDVADQIVTAELDLEAVGHDAVSATRFGRSLLARLDRDPRIRGAALAGSGGREPLLGGQTVFRHLSASAGDRRVAELQVVTDGWFDAMGLRLVAGRALTAADRGPLAVVNQTLADLVAPGRSGVGERLIVGLDRDTVARIGATPGDESVTDVPVEIVGVVEEAIRHPRRTRDMPRIVLPLAGELPLQTNLVVRGDDAASLLPVVREAIAASDARPPWSQIETMRGVLVRWMGETPYFAAAVAGLGAVALGLAVAGLYAVVVYVVSLRTREIGVRIALGARRSQVVGLMIRQALRVVGAGAAVGAILAVPIVYVTRANFVGVSPLDPIAIVPALLLFGVVAVVASAIPSRRAATVDPVDALRAE
jgi:predicted permease